MKNIITTIPKSKFPNWATAEQVCKLCDGETIRRGGKPWFWLINAQRPPKDDIVGSLCYMIYDGKVRGYFDIIQVDDATNWHWHNDPIYKKRKGYSIIMANWHSLSAGEEMSGFQGWRYTHLTPLL